MVLLKNAEDLSEEQKKKLAFAFLLAPQLKMFYEYKEKFRSIFNQPLTKEAGEIALNQWIEEAKAMKNKWFIAGCCGICPVKPVLPHQEG